ncbi:MAG: type II toxin-antitoxin system VapC family toxin [Vulcanimicrobiaceae bacterium]
MEIPSDPVVYAPARIRTLGFKPIAITPEHALAGCALPNHHTDPFDRIMVARAQVEALVFVTSDKNVLKYAVNTLEAA